MTPQEKSVCSYLASKRDEMLDLLNKLVSIDSGSRCSEGISAVSAEIARFLREKNVITQTIPSDAYGNCLRASVAATSKALPIIIMGHCDTVFREGEALRRPFRINGERAYGPGVADMKGGLVLNAFVLAALAAIEREKPHVIGLFTVDEEIASPWSRTIIQETCRNARAVFNSEPGRPNGNIVTGRNGGIFFRIDIEGKAAHSGTNFASGINAVIEAAHKVVLLSALTDPNRGVTANPGVIGGGDAFNIVPAQCFIEAEVRYRFHADREKLLSEVENIAAAHSVPGTASRFTLYGEFPPFEKNEGTQALEKIYAAATAQIGFPVDSEFSGGCSDAGFAAAEGIPTLCAVGPVGGHAHTHEEYLEIDTLVPRAQALALSTLRVEQLELPPS